MLPDDDDDDDDDDVDDVDHDDVDPCFKGDVDFVNGNVGLSEFFWRQTTLCSFSGQQTYPLAGT